MDKNNIIMAVCTLLEPLTIMGMAAVIWKLPSGYGEAGFSFSTKSAKKSPEAWAYAQHHFGKTTFFSHLAALIVTIAVMVTAILIEVKGTLFSIVVSSLYLLQILVITVNIIETQIRLKKLFGE